MLLKITLGDLSKRGRYTRGRMAKCYHKACDVWDPTTRSPHSPRFLAAVTKAVLDSVLEMAEEEIVKEDMVDEEVAEKDVIEEDVMDYVKVDIKEDIIEEDVVKVEMVEETTIEPALTRDEVSNTASRGSEAVAVPRKAFSRDILAQK